MRIEITPKEHMRDTRVTRRVRDFVEKQAREIAHEGGCSFSPSGWTAMLIVDELQRMGAAFQLEFAPGLGILVKCASPDMKHTMEVVGKYSESHELL